MNDIQRLICCCRRRKQNKQITHLTTSGDPTTIFIYSGLDSLNISVSSPLIIADFGSSYGRHSIQMMKLIIEYLRKTDKFLGIPLIVHNDIPANNWTRFFQRLRDDNTYHGLASGRSFYEQCLPSNSLSIGLSSASLHYLSKIPCHIIDHCYIQFANDNERELFRNQSKLDLHLFIELRSRELISGGILILMIPCTGEQGEMGFNSYFDLIYKCAQSLSLLTANELLHLTLPFYLRSFAECVDAPFFRRCSLQLIRVELICLKSLLVNQYRHGEITRDHLAKSLTMLMRPGTEMALQQAMQVNRRSDQEINEISTRFWCLYERQVKDQLPDDDINTYATYLILKKK